MIKNLNKKDLFSLSFDELEKINKELLLISKLEKILKEGAKKKIEFFPKEILGEKEIDNIELYIKKFEKESDSLISEIYKEYKPTIKIKKAYTNNQEIISNKTKEILSSNFINDLDSKEKEQLFLDLLAKNMFILKNEVTALLNINIFERDTLFKNISIDKIDAISMSIAMRLNQENILSTELCLKNKNIEIIEELTSEKKIIKEKKSFFSKKEILSDLDFFVDSLTVLLRVYFESMYLIGKSNELLNKEIINNDFLKLEERERKFSSYLLKITIEISKRVKEITTDEQKVVITKEENDFLKKLIINNILFFNSSIEINEPKDLSKFF